MTTITGPDRGEVRITFAVQTRTRLGWWRTVRTESVSFPHRPDLNGTAETIFGNARQVLGLGPRQRMPKVRVRTWDDQGRTGFANRVQPFDLTLLLKGSTTPVTSKIQTLWFRFRLWLAQTIAPAGVDVHDPDDTLCPEYQGILEAALKCELRAYTAAGDDLVLFDITETVAELAGLHIIKRLSTSYDARYQLTAAGEKELARLWGPFRYAPWEKGLLWCATHGSYPARPGRFRGCPVCRSEDQHRHLKGLLSTFTGARKEGQNGG